MTVAPLQHSGSLHRGRAELAIARRAFTQVRIGAVVLAVAFGVSAYVTSTTYAATYPTEQARRQAAALMSGDAGLRVLLGPVSDIATVGGYTVYKNFVFLTTIGAVWALLAGTRVLRGEEDAGRWQLTLAGSTRPARATAATLSALAAAVAVIFVGATSLALLAARDSDLGLAGADTVLYGLSLVVVPAVFAALGALSSQLCRTRRAATGLGLGLAATAFVARMIADTGSAGWVRWLTPFGWVELMRPYTGNDAWPLLPAAATTIAMSVAATVLAGRRDLGSGLLAPRDVAGPRAFGLGSVTAMSTRLQLPTLLAWCLGAGAAGMVFGVFAEITTAEVPDSLRETLDRYGVQGSFASQFLGIVFLLIATVVALLPAGQVGAAAAEEASGRLVQILSRPPRRSGWLLGRLLLSAVAVVVAGLLGGLGTWVGARVQGVDLGLGTLIGAGLNVVPTALVALGVGALMLSLASRFAAAAVYALVGWSVLVNLLAPLGSGLAWADRLSLFHYMALLPGQDADATIVLTVSVVALLLCAAATVAFGRRDISAG